MEASGLCLHQIRLAATVRSHPNLLGDEAERQPKLRTAVKGSLSASFARWSYVRRGHRNVEWTLNVLLPSQGTPPLGGRAGA